MGTRERYSENSYAEIWFEDGIIYTVFKPDVSLNLTVVKEVVSMRLQVSNKINSPIFIDLRNVVYTDTEARKYMAKRESVEYLTAGGLLIDNEIMRLAGNIFIKIDKPLIPTKLFTDKDKAMRWLQPYRFIN